MASTSQKLGNAPLQAIKKINLTSKEEISWSAGPSGFVSEPIMVPSETLQKKMRDFYLYFYGTEKEEEAI